MIHRGRADCGHLLIDTLGDSTTITKPCCWNIFLRRNQKDPVPWTAEAGLGQFHFRYQFVLPVLDSTLRLRQDMPLASVHVFATMIVLPLFNLFLFHFGLTSCHSHA